MRSNAWDLLRAEHAELGAGSLIEAELREALRPVIGRVPNPRLVGRSADHWDADLREDVLYDFALFMLEHGRLNAAFVHAGDVDHFRMLLRMRARQFVSGKLRSGELARKVAQACEILEDDADRFQSRGSGSARRWSLQGSDSAAFSDDDAELRQLAWKVPLPKSRRFRRDTKHASAVISRPDLKALLVRILETADAALSKRQIEVLLRERLALREPETISISMRLFDDDALEDVIASKVTGIDEADDAFVASDAAQLLTLQQLAILREYYALRHTREQVARTLGISTGTVSNELRRAGRVLLQVSLNDEELAHRALDALFK